MENFLKPYQRKELAKQDVTYAYTRTLSEKTARAYKKAICDFFQILNLEDITKEMIEATTVDIANQYIDHLADHGYAPSSINLKLSALHNLFEFMTRRDIKWAEYNPFDVKEGCKRLRVQTDYSKVYCATQDDAQKMISVCNENSIVNTRDKLIIMLLATTGMRREEVTNIKLKDIMMYDNEHVCLIHGKGNKERFCLLDEDVFGLIERYLEQRRITFSNEEEYLIINHSHNYENTKISTQSMNNIVKKIAKKAKANPDKISCHSMRRFFATESFKLGEDLMDIQTQLGHSKIATTQKYIYHDKLLKTSKTKKLAKMIKGEG